MPRIVIADDEWVTRVEIEEMLSGLGYEVVGQAESGAKAIGMVRNLEPDLIIMNIMMPGEINGIEAARVIKAEWGTPIIFITGYGDPEYIETAKEIAPFGYVMKPFDEREIHAFVEIALSKRELEVKLMKAHEDLERANLILHKEIATRKKTEEDLRQSEERYRILVENAGEAIFVAQEGMLKFVNKKTEELSGRTQTELLSTTFDNFIHPDDRAFVLERQVKRQQGIAVPSIYPFRLIDKSGDVKWVESNAVEIVWEDRLATLNFLRDITDRKRAEEALRESERLYHDIFEKNKAIKWILDPSAGKIVDANSAACEFYQYSYEEMTKLYLWDINLLGETEIKKLLASAESEKQAEFTLKHRLASGEIRTVHVYTGTVVSGGKKLLHSIIIDITDRHRAEKALRDSKKRLQAITDSALDAIFCKDMNRRTTFVNPAMLQLMGCTEADLIGKPPEEVFNEENAVIVNEVDERTLNGEKVNEIRSLSIAGRTYTLQTIQVPLRDSDGNITGISGIVRDMTDLMQAQEALRESKAKYETIFNLVPVGIAVSDNAGNIVEYNKIGGKILGLSKKEYLKRRIDSHEWHFVKQDGTPMSADEYPSIQSLRENRLVENVEVVIVKGTGETRWINVSATPIPMEDYGVAIAYIDITNRKKAEEQVQESLDEKVLLLGEIHHRVKNNLQVISSLMDLTRRSTLNEEAKMVLADARSKIYAMSLVHSQLYRSESFTRIDMAVHVRGLLGSMGQIYTNSYRRVRPRLECSKVFLSVTQAIPCALVLNELISNVYKHAYPGDATGECLISMAEKDGKWIRFRVKDDGVGIPDDIDVESNETLGLKLIRNLVRKQLKGEVQFKRDNGMDITAEFPIDHDDLLIH